MEKFNVIAIIRPGRKSQETLQAKQHVPQVEIILQESSQHSFHKENLFDRKNIRDNWLVYFEQVQKLGTFKSYVHFLRLFYKFVLCDDM